ncbi:hypothetical protein BZG13_12815 [Salinivibrio sp. ML323]|nr:hypothetical protein BZG13_12815 [Salinivibrio sp. ML323]
MSDGARPAWVFMTHIVLALMPTYANGGIGVCPTLIRDLEYGALRLQNTEKSKARHDTLFPYSVPRDLGP